MSSQAPLHVVFGAGQIGSLLAAELQRRGLRVRVVRRSARPAGEGIEVVAGDAMDPVFAREAAAGAAVIYHCMNPSSYSARAWQAEFPRLGAALVGAALHTGARLVCLDNLYGYGVVGGRRTEATPLGATGPKGAVRVAWDHTLRTTPGLRFAVGRAGDFFGPGASGAMLTDATVAGITAGKRPWLFGDVMAPHAFSAVADVVAGLAALGTAEADVEGQVFHLPVVEVSPHDVLAAVQGAVGVVAPEHVLPAWLVRVLGPVVPILGEFRETLYQWDRPFLVSDARFRTRFPGVGSTLAEVVHAWTVNLPARAVAKLV